MTDMQPRAVTDSTLVDESRVIDRSQTRSVVMSSHGIVAAEHPLAALAGASVLSRGGHAVDAAIAANAVMGVVAPMMNGIGGDLFALVYEATSGRLSGLNASGWAPAGLSIDFLRRANVMAMPRWGINSVTVPGAVDGWTLLMRRFGRMELRETLAPAIRYAEDGVPVTELFAEQWSWTEQLLLVDDSAARTYLPLGRAPRVGAVFRNPDLAWSYNLIAQAGRDAFYLGPIAERIVDCSRHHGGTFTAADLGDFSSEWVDPISTTYRGWTVYELPPNGQGIAVLMMLNIMEAFPLDAFGHNSARALHVMIEAKKLAYADLMQHIGDPRFASIPVTELLAKGYAHERSKCIDMARAQDHVSPGHVREAGDDTTYLATVDRDGNMVSLIQSVYSLFGSGIVPQGTGFVLQNRGRLFTLEPMHPNALCGRKRPFHTIIPAFMMQGDMRIAFGIMGGWNQAQAHAQFVSNVVDHRMNIQSALDAPRFTKPTFTGCDLHLETRVPSVVRSELEARGHQIEVRGDYSSRMGGGQAVARDMTAGVNYGASDPRKDGAAIPEPLQFL